MKTDLQIRAENAAVSFYGARKPVIFEFAGVPKAGKTSTSIALQTFLKRCGFRVEVVSDRTSLCPIRDKTHSDFNVWTACTTLVQILEKTRNPPRFDDPDILILDRGLFDAVCWLRLMERLDRIRPEECQRINSFLSMADWRKRISAVFVMMATPGDALQREKAILPTERKAGSIMNEKVLAEMIHATRETSRNLKREFRIFEIDTSAGRKDGAKAVAEAVTNLALKVIEEHLREDMLSLPKEDVCRIFAGKKCLNFSQASALVKSLVKAGNYRPKQELEADQTRFQILTVVVVRNHGGRVFCLRRKKSTDGNPPNEKLVIWTGGPVRKEDAANGNSILQSALRGIQEDLRLGLAPDELQLRGAVFAGPGGEGTQKRVAIVYEWKARIEAAAIVLSQAVISDKCGRAVSGTFVPLKDIVRNVDDGKLTEELSVEIIRELLATDYKFSPRLF